MSDDATEWVTIKVPEEDRDRARDYKPDGVTWGDCIVTGAERLNDHLDSEPDLHATAAITPTLDEDALDGIIQQIQDEIGTLAFQGAVTEAEAERIMGRLDDLEERLPAKVAAEVNGDD